MKCFIYDHSFLVSVSLLRLNLSRRGRLFDVPCGRYQILLNAYFQAWSISRCYSSVFFNRSVEILFQDPLKTKKTVGLDKISVRLLKDSLDVITPCVTNLQIIVNFNKMLETLIFQRSYPQYLY